jgi:hypothetical protein
MPSTPSATHSASLKRATGSDIRLSSAAHDQTEATGLAVRYVVDTHAAFAHAEHLSLRSSDPVLVNFAVGWRVRRDGKHVIPQRARAQQPAAYRGSVIDLVDLPIAPGIGPAQAWVAEREGQGWLPLAVKRQLRRELVEIGFQFGMELNFDMPLEEAAQPPTGSDDRSGNPEQGAGQQA